MQLPAIISHVWPGQCLLGFLVDLDLFDLVYKVSEDCPDYILNTAAAWQIFIVTCDYQIEFVPHAALRLPEDTTPWLLANTVSKGSASSSEQRERKLESNPRLFLDLLASFEHI